MKVDNIRPYNQNSPAFGAKVRITGSTDFLPQIMVDMIRAKARTIGHRNDLIMFYFGKRQINILPSLEGDIMHQCRNVFVKSRINNKVMDGDLSYNVYNKIEESSMILEAVHEYLGNLVKYISSK